MIFDTFRDHAPELLIGSGILVSCNLSSDQARCSICQTEYPRNKNEFGRQSQMRTYKIFLLIFGKNPANKK